MKEVLMLKNVCGHADTGDGLEKIQIFKKYLNTCETS
jgi:hypothetical protein